MFDKILETAHDTGAEVMVQLNCSGYEQYVGRVLELEQEYFSLFHSGYGGGVHWAFKRSDISFIGLIVDPPDINNTRCKLSDSNDEPLRLKKDQSH